MTDIRDFRRHPHAVRQRKPVAQLQVTLYEDGHREVHGPVSDPQVFLTLIAIAVQEQSRHAVEAEKRKIRLAGDA